MTRKVSVTIDIAGVLSIQDDTFVPAVGITRQTLPVAGGALEIDVHAPQHGIRAVIDDDIAAAWWVPFVFGEESADALGALAVLDDAERPQTHTVPATITPEVDLADVVPRLLVGFWFRRWWPAGVVDAALLEWLLDAELGALAAEAEVLFGGPDIAKALLSGHLEVLAADVERALSHGVDGLTPERVSVIQRAALAASDVADDAAPGFDSVQDAADGLHAAAGIHGAVADTADGSVVLADLAADTGTPLDWTTVHPRQLSASAGALRIAAYDTADGVSIEITVDAPSRIVSVSVEPDELYATVGEGPDAEATVLRPDGERFIGAVSLPVGAATTVRVSSDVYGPVARSSDLTRAAAVRAEVLDLVRARLTTGAIPGIVPFAFERQLVRDSVARSHERIVQSAVSDLDVQWLLLTETTFAFRDGTTTGAFTTTDEDACVRIELIPQAHGWMVRADSLGHDGPVSVRIRFASGVEHAVVLDVTEGGLADALIGVPKDDTPTAVRIEVSSQ